MSAFWTWAFQSYKFYVKGQDCLATEEKNWSWQTRSYIFCFVQQIFKQTYCILEILNFKSLQFEFALVYFFFTNINKLKSFKLKSLTCTVGSLTFHNPGSWIRDDVI